MEKTFYGLLGIFNLLPWFCAILELSRGGGSISAETALAFSLALFFEPMDD
jgi:hypothetical protein